MPTDPPGLATTIAALPAEVLHQLAVIAERRENTAAGWSRLDPDALEEGTNMLAAGVIPGFGWWRAHLAPHAPPTPEWPDMPPAGARRPWQPWELVAAAVSLADDHIATDVAVDVLAQLAAGNSLGRAALVDAYTALGLA